MQYCIFPVSGHLRQQNTQCHVFHSLHGMYVCYGTYLCTCCITLTWFDKLINFEVDNKVFCVRCCLVKTFGFSSLFAALLLPPQRRPEHTPSWVQCAAACCRVGYWATEESDSRPGLLVRVHSKASALTRILNTSSVSLNHTDVSSAPKTPVYQKLRDVLRSWAVLTYCQLQPGWRSSGQCAHGSPSALGRIVWPSTDKFASVNELLQ